MITQDMKQMKIKKYDKGWKPSFAIECKTQAE